jgi:glycosyltransferase involved in cell wall biosynthesis
MKVSIIIPVYNAERYLRECIESTLSQTYKDIEIIAVDDGSTDDSLNILKKYSNKIKIISKPNGGTASALNLGIRNMTGEWFKWLSADDILYKNCIEILVNEINLLGNKSQNCIFYFSYDYIDENSNIIAEFIESNYNNLDLFNRNVVLLDHFYGNGTTCLIHKSIFEKYGLFDEKIGYQEDYEFWLRCCVLHEMKLHLVPHKLAKYRIHKNQMTRQKLTENISHARQIRDLILKKIDPVQRQKYIQAVKNFQSTKPIKLRIRRKIRDLLFSILPKNISNDVLKIYLSRKKY